MPAINRILFPKTAWFLLLLIPFTFFGFYPTYFSKLFSTETIFHVHAFFMLLWVAMAIMQPILILKKKTKLHKLIGRWSYIVMPLVFTTAYLLIRHVYYLQITKLEAGSITNTTPNLSSMQTRAEAAKYITIGVVYLAWLMVYYILAVINRKKMLFHATYMFAAILTLLGPTLDRLIYFTLTGLGWHYGFLAQHFVFFFNLALLVSLLIYQWRKGNSLKPSAVALSIYIIGMLIFFFLPETKIWVSFVELIV